MQNYEITTDISRFDLDAIHAFLSQTYWSPGIPKETVARACANSLCFGVLLEGKQIGLARVITDRATYGYLADVYLLEAHRGKGLAHRIMTAVKQHPDLQGLRRIMLATRDAHGLYEKYGFKRVVSSTSMMEIHRPDAYKA